MRRPLVLALLAAALVLAMLVAAGCGGDSTAAEPEPPPPPTAPQPPAPPSPPPPPAKPSPTFVRADLARIALGAKNAPPGLRYVKAESGPMVMETIIALPEQRAPLRALGFRAMHDSVFAAKAPGNDQRVSQRIWLFKNRRGASAWLQKTKDDSVALQFAPLTAPVLGDESWAAGGLIQIGGGQAITHAFRLGNTVHTVAMYGDVTPPNEEGALAAAQAALAKAQKR
jgi:hypothetical protein